MGSHVASKSIISKPLYSDLPAGYGLPFIFPLSRKPFACQINIYVHTLYQINIFVLKVCYFCFFFAITCRLMLKKCNTLLESCGVGEVQENYLQKMWGVECGDLLTS